LVLIRESANASERARRLATTLRSQSAELRQLRDDLRAAQAQQQKDQERIATLQEVSFLIQQL
jgi:hypothetical protein